MAARCQGDACVGPHGQDRSSAQSGFSSEELYRIVAPRRTLARRKEHAEPLSPAESDRALRLERIAEQADHTGTCDARNRSRHLPAYRNRRSGRNRNDRTGYR
ncbi:antitoxin Xre-like helix-turn-helix domain-containing protein [Mesorhizobium sp.]|uniref:antitoxin Xre-like helix-turn-helix domain-containing protein n=1 Tax=Mesorhizobium sp. TaxID=1871066 RepID=UPI0034579E4E